MFDGLITRLDRAEERISEVEKIVQISQTEIQREKNNEQNRAVYIKENASNNIKRCNIPITGISKQKKREWRRRDT